MICPLNNVLIAFEKENDCWDYKLIVPEWCDDHTRGCHMECGVVVAGSKKDAHCQEINLLNILTEEKKELPNLVHPSACVGMAWDPRNNSLILAGGDQHRDGEWNVTDEMFLLTNVGEKDSKWKPLPCKLPHAMNDPELLMSDRHLYLLGCGETRKCAERIPRDKIWPDSKPDDNKAYTMPIQHFCPNDWEKLEDLDSEINGKYSHGGAVFTQGRVIVFTLHHVMTLNSETKPPSWTTVEIEKDLKYCIPRLLNGDTILVLVNHLNKEKALENFIEMYDTKKGTWKPWKPSVQNVNVKKASLVPWKFFVVHTVDVPKNFLVTKHLQYRDHLFQSGN